MACSNATIQEVFRRGTAAAIRIVVPKNSPDVSVLIQSGDAEPVRQGFVINLEGPLKGKDVLLKHDPDGTLPPTMPDIEKKTVILEAPISNLLRNKVNVFLYEKPAVEMNGDLQETPQYTNLIDHVKIPESGDVFIVRSECARKEKNESWCQDTHMAFEQFQDAYPHQYFVKDEEGWLACTLSPDGSHKPYRFKNGKKADVPIQVVSGKDPCELQYFKTEKEARVRCAEIGCTMMLSINNRTFAPFIAAENPSYNIFNHAVTPVFPQACNYCQHADLPRYKLADQICCECGGGVSNGDSHSIPVKRFDQEKRYVITDKDIHKGKGFTIRHYPEGIGIGYGLKKGKMKVGSRGSSAGVSAPLIIGGGLLVLLAIGAGVFMYTRRRQRVYVQR